MLRLSLFCLFVVFLLTVMSGCKEDDGGNDISNDTGDTSSVDKTSDDISTESTDNGKNDTGEEDSNAWLENFVAPLEWTLPTDCGTVGESCENLNGCGDDSICQTEGWVCTPDFTEEERTRSEAYPYCMSYACMSYEEASCYCTGKGAEVNAAKCSGGPRAVLGQCAMENKLCTELTCCGDLECIEVIPRIKKCQLRCENNDDCETGCCSDLLGIGVMVCAPASECEDPCVPHGGACEDTPDCCTSMCVSSPDDRIAGCRHYCYEDEDCGFGCCLPFDSGGGFCADDIFCGK
ncbi:MAG: hypothetical protein JXR76_01870 [Deltaproteobacteria bacterium]|nr:hypothetical protein [Deltaproteobacteria bacterium]